MLDTGQALRPTGGYEYVDGAEVLATETLFTSRCKIQTRTLVSREAEVGGRTATVVRVELHLPAKPPPGVSLKDYALTVGDLFEVLDPAPDVDASAGLVLLGNWQAPDQSTVPVGRRYRILAPHEKTHPTARRYDVEVVVT